MSDQLHNSPESVVDAFCDRFENAWLAGHPERIESCLANCDSSLQEHLLGELLRIELELRRKAGDSPQEEEYLERFATHSQVVREVFSETIKHIAETPCTLAVGGIHVRCPHCHNPIELVADAEMGSIDCPSCGSNFSLISDESSTRHALSVKEFAHFKLVERLGAGGFGTVWKARDTKLDRTVAVKIPRQGQLDKQEEEQFLREARSAAQLNHPNIVSVHEVGREDDTIYIVSDLVRGVPLSEVIADSRLSFQEGVELVTKLANALHHAHERGVIHRDLKPQNVMIDDQGEPHLMDFGLAKREAGEITMTIDGAILGTPAYMSPEQARGEGHHVDRRTDVYSLGVILFQLLTGELPFRGTPQMLLQKVLTDEAPSLRHLDVSVPKDLETITLKCLEKEPEKRYSSAQLVSQELKRFSNGQSIVARPIGRLQLGLRWAKRNRTVAALTSVLLVTLLTGLTITTLLWRNAELAIYEKGIALKEKKISLLRELESKEVERRAVEAEAKSAQEARRSLIASDLSETDSIIQALASLRLDSKNTVKRDESLEKIKKAARIASNAENQINILAEYSDESEVQDFRIRLKSLQLSLRNEASRWLQLATLRKVKTESLRSVSSLRGERSVDEWSSQFRTSSSRDGSTAAIIAPGRNELQVYVVDLISGNVRDLTISGLMLGTYGAKSGIVRKVAISTDGSKLVVLDSTPSLQLYDLSSGEKLQRWSLSREIHCNELVCEKKGQVKLRGFTEDGPQEMEWNLADGTYSLKKWERDSENYSSDIGFDSLAVRGSAFDAFASRESFERRTILTLKKSVPALVVPSQSSHLKLSETGHANSHSQVTQKKEISSVVYRRELDGEITAIGFGGNPSWLAYSLNGRIFCHDQTSGVTVYSSLGEPGDPKVVVQIFPSPQGFYAIQLSNLASDSRWRRLRYRPKTNAGMQVELVSWKVEFPSYGSEVIEQEKCLSLATAKDGYVFTGGEDSIVRAYEDTRRLWDSNAAISLSASFVSGTGSYLVSSIAHKQIDGRYSMDRSFALHSSESGAHQRSFPASGVGTIICQSQQPRLAVILREQSDISVTYEAWDLSSRRVLGRLGPFHKATTQGSQLPAATFSPKANWLFVLDGKQLRIWRVPSLKPIGVIDLAGASSDKTTSSRLVYSDAIDSLAFDSDEKYAFVRPLRAIYDLPTVTQVSELNGWPGDLIDNRYEAHIVGNHVFAVEKENHSVRDGFMRLKGVWELQSGRHLGIELNKGNSIVNPEMESEIETQEASLSAESIDAMSEADARQVLDKHLQELLLGSMNSSSLNGRTPEYEEGFARRMQRRSEVAEELVELGNSKKPKEALKKLIDTYGSSLEDTRELETEKVISEAESGKLQSEHVKEFKTIMDAVFDDNSIVAIEPTGRRVLALCQSSERKSNEARDPFRQKTYDFCILWDLASDTRPRTIPFKGSVEWDESSPVLAIDRSHVYLESGKWNEAGGSESVLSMEWSSGDMKSAGQFWTDRRIHFTGQKSDVLLWKQKDGLFAQVLPEDDRILLEHTQSFIPVNQYVSPNRKYTILKFEKEDGTKDYHIGLWNLGNGRQIAELESGGEVVFDESGRWCAMIEGERGVLTILDCKDGSIRYRLKPPWMNRRMTTRFYDYDLSTTGSRMLVQGQGMILLWDLEKNQELMRVKRNHIRSATSVAIRPTLNVVASGSEDGSVIVRDFDTGEYKRNFVEFVGAIKSLAFDYDGQHLLALSEDGSVCCWGRDSWKHQSAAYASARALRCHPSKATVAIGTTKGKIHLLSLTDGKRLDGWDTNDKNIISLAYSTDGTRLASGHDDGSIVVWSVSSKKPVATFRTQGPVNTLQWLEKGGKLVSASLSIEIWDVGQASSVWTIPISKGPAKAMEVQQDHGRLVVADASGTVRITDLSKLEDVLEDLGIAKLSIGEIKSER